MITAKLVKHQDESRIALYFEYNPQLIEEIKKIQGRRWSQTLKAWHIPATKENRKRYQLPLFDADYLSEEKQQKINYFEHWLLAKRYSPNTIKTYMDVVQVFLHFFNHKSTSEITNDDVILFNNEYILKKQLSSSYQNQFVNGVKLFFETVENRKMVVSIILRPRVERKLPHVLSKEEVKAILTSHANMKHRVMLSLIYACGLRRSELLNLKPSDILSDRHLIHVYQAKGKKDRVVPISDKIIEMLREYYRVYRPKVWMFEGQEPGVQYSEGSLRKIFKTALEKCKITKPATLHWLRHSYATHLLESGTDIRYIQELLGHNSSRTTEIYTHVCNRNIQQIKSPFDDL